MKKLLVIVMLAAAGYAVYAYVLRPPEQRACGRLAELCGLDPDGAQVLRCRQTLDALKPSNTATATQFVTCVGGAKTCGEAAGCASGVALSAGAGLAKDFLSGLQKMLP